jgi:hypothetical protein
LDRTVDDLLPPPSGPGPITFDPAHPYVANRGTQPTYRVADLNNPSCSPGPGADEKANEVLAGKSRSGRARVPIGVPGFVSIR